MTEDYNIGRRIKFFIILIAFIFVLGIIGFKIITGNSFLDSLMMTLESLAFMFRSAEGAAKILQLVLAIFGVMTFGWIISNFFEMFIGGHFSEYLKTQGLLTAIRKMKNHFIIAGGGRVGEELAREISKKGKKYIIIEKNKEKVEKLKAKNFVVIAGDVSESDASDLKLAGIKNAKAIILALPETEKNLMLTMTAKELNPKIEIYARADNPAFVGKLRKAGASVVVVPEVAAAEKFLKEIKY